MDADKDIAEERLLRVIEKGQARSATISLGANKGGGLFKWFRSWMAQHYSRPIARESDVTLRLMRSLSTILWFLLTCFGIYFAFDVISQHQSPFKHKLVEGKNRMISKTTDSMNAVLEEKLQPEDHYVQALQNPNPFTGAGADVKVEEPVVRTESAAQKLAEMSKGLVVVGINRGAIPDAIIENSEQKKTFFVKAGDMVNDLKVKEVKRDTVVLTYEGEDVEIA